MAVEEASAGRLATRQIARATGFRVDLMSDWKQAASCWNDYTSPTPFQDHRWLDSWYRAFDGADGIEPLIAVVVDASTGMPAMLLPLVRHNQNGIKIVEFADLVLTDYNAPLLGPSYPRNAHSARRLWRDLRTALQRLPGGCDLVRLRKMPVELAGQPNPLALLDGASACPLNGNIVVTGDDFDAWRYTLEKVVRKELERSWRVFTRDTAAAFNFVSDGKKALEIIATMEVQQAARMQKLGQKFVLNDETCAVFYRNLIENGLNDGYVVVSALTVGDEVVAALLGIRRGAGYVMLRISNAGEKWSNCSPGRLIIERTMAALHKDGVCEFDFSIGNYAYKRRFGVARIPLADLSAATSWRGWPSALRDRAAGELRRHPLIENRLRRWLGRPPVRDEN